MTLLDLANDFACFADRITGVTNTAVSVGSIPLIVIFRVTIATIPCKRLRFSREEQML
jgi:hypothetical protein